ncbi:MAG: hypothetical protein SNJ71_00365 [Bacteroidales bacterium]
MKSFLKIFCDESSIKFDDRTINQAIAKYLNDKVEKIIRSKSFLERYREIIDELFQSSPEFLSLSSGILKDIFNLQLFRSFYDSMISAIVSNTRVYYRKMNGSIPGLIQIETIRSDYSEVLSLPGAKIQGVEWLKFLLLEGDKWIKVSNITVTPSQILYTNVNPTPDGAYFRIPSEFSGTIDNNWILRSLDELGYLVTNYIASRLQYE